MHVKEPNPQTERMARTQTVSPICTMSRRHQGFLSSRFLCACRCGGPVGAALYLGGSQCRVHKAGSTSGFSLPFSQDRRLRPPPPPRTFPITSRQVSHGTDMASRPFPSLTNEPLIHTYIPTYQPTHRPTKGVIPRTLGAPKGPAVCTSSRS